MKKLVLKLELHDDKAKRKAMKAVSRLSGIDSIAMDMKDRKLTVTGDVDPVEVVKILRKAWHTEVLTVGPAKEEKKDDKKKEEGKKDDKKLTDKQIQELLQAYKPYPQYYHVVSAEENPNACVIL